jgi:hypothetical protein
MVDLIKCIPLTNAKMPIIANISVIKSLILQQMSHKYCSQQWIQEVVETLASVQTL